MTATCVTPLESDTEEVFLYLFLKSDSIHRFLLAALYEDAPDVYRSTLRKLTGIAQLKYALCTLQHLLVHCESRPGDLLDDQFALDMAHILLAFLGDSRCESDAITYAREQGNNSTRSRTNTSRSSGEWLQAHSMQARSMLSASEQMKLLECVNQFYIHALLSCDDMRMNWCNTWLAWIDQCCTPAKHFRKLIHIKQVTYTLLILT